MHLFSRTFSEFLDWIFISICFPFLYIIINLTSLICAHLLFFVSPCALVHIYHKPSLVHLCVIISFQFLVLHLSLFKQIPLSFYYFPICLSTLLDFFIINPNPSFVVNKYSWTGETDGRGDVSSLYCKFLGFLPFILERYLPTNSCDPFCQDKNYIDEK